MIFFFFKKEKRKWTEFDKNDRDYNSKHVRQCIKNKQTKKQKNKMWMAFSKNDKNNYNSKAHANQFKKTKCRWHFTKTTKKKFLATENNNSKHVTM